jgi:NhaP-type Na+/H+ or K+/H+ antiporter
MAGVWISSKDNLMLIFVYGIMLGFVVGYGVGLLMDKWDRKIKNDRG